MSLKRDMGHPELWKSDLGHPPEICITRMSQERPLAIRRYISIPISGSKSTRKEFFNKFLDRAC